MPESDLDNPDLSPGQFAAVAALAHERWGLHLPESKYGIVGSRLATHVRRAGYGSFDAYLDRLKAGATEEDMLAFFDVLSTNVTSFFRDPEQFAFLEREFYTGLARGTTTTPGRRVRVWSAACSTGAEPYSVAMQARDLLKDLGSWDFKILGTDLSTSALAAARRAVYPASMVSSLGREQVGRHFQRGTGRCSAFVKLRPEVTGLVSLSRLNLVEPWPMKGPFQIILCKNVMIYFDRQTRVGLIRRFHDLLAPGGILMLGSAETMTGLDLPFRSAGPSIYIK